MNRGKNSSKKNSRRQNTRKTAPAQRRGPSFNQRAHVPWRFPLFPRQLQFSSKWSQTLDINLGVTQYNRIAGLFSFYNQIPQYALSCYNIYRYCRITGVHVALTLAPDVTGEYSAVEMAMARVPFDESSSPTPATLHIARDSRYALAASSGAPQTKIQGSWASFDELGNPVYDKSFWQTRAEAGSTTLDADEPVIAIAVRSVNQQAATVSLNLEISYHMEFFDLEIDDETSVQIMHDPIQPVLVRKPALRTEVEEFTPLEDTLDDSRLLRRREPFQKAPIRK